MIEFPFKIQNSSFYIHKMGKVKVTQVRSIIGQTARQKKTVEALGLRKINHTVEHEATPQILGMIRKVAHIVKTEEV